jgi:hypothetical protein
MSQGITPAAMIQGSVKVTVAAMIQGSVNPFFRKAGHVGPH